MLQNDRGLRLVVGLGNPGELYQRTPHNVGFECLDLAAHAMSGRWQRLRSVSAAVLWVEGQGALLKPMAYMNRSGVVLGRFLREHPRYAEEILVVCDDYALPLGELRFRSGGGHGGHNGLRDLLAHVGAPFCRLRLGVGPAWGPPADFVLRRFAPEAWSAAQEMQSRAVLLVQAFLQGGEAALNSQMSQWGNRPKVNQSADEANRSSPPTQG